MTELFNKEWLKESEYPANFIPKDARICIGIDYAVDGGDCTCKGFWLNGEFHLQRLERNIK